MLQLYGSSHMEVYYSNSILQLEKIVYLKCESLMGLKLRKYTVGVSDTDGVDLSGGIHYFINPKLKDVVKVIK